MSFTDVNGIKICYEITGDGYPLFLVHGYTGRKELWFTQVGMLSEKFKVITFDLRNSGKSDHLDEPITMEMFANDIKGLMDFLDIEKAHIAGQSMGGMIVQQFVLAYPERVNKVILMQTGYSVVDMADFVINTIVEALKEGKQDPESAFWNLAPFAYHREFRKQLEENPKKKFHGLFSAEDLIEMNANNPATIEDAKYQAHALKTFNAFDRLSEIKNPTLLISASHDRVFAKQLVEMHEKIPDSTLKILKKAGHSASQSRAPEINNMIINFLKSS